MKSDNKTPHKAEDYDRNISRTIPYYELFHRETIDLVSTVTPHAGIWLDTGCGTGSLIQSAIDRFPDCTFIVTDPSAGMLARCKDKLIQYADRILFLDPMGSENLVIDQTCRPDVITAIQSHHYFDAAGRKRATSRCYDLLNDNGIYITFENVRPETGKGIEYGLDRWMKFQAAQGRTEEEIIEHRKRFDSEYFPVTVNDHVSLLKNTGFRVAEIFWLSHMQAGFYGIK